MTASVAQFAQVADWGVTTNPKTVTGLAWSAGDKILVIAGGETATAAQFANVPTNANLTLAVEVSSSAGGNTECPIYVWSAIAASGQTGQTISLTASASTGFWGMAVIVITGTDGVDANGQADLTESAFTFTPAAGSVVVYAHFDWNATATKTQTTASGTPTERRDVASGANYSQYIGTWDGVAATSQAWGITDYTGMIVARAVIEVHASGGTNFTRTVDDPEGLTDARALEVGLGLTDSAGLSDSVQIVGPVEVIYEHTIRVG